MFLVTSRLGQVGLFISVVGKNTWWLDVSYQIHCLKEGFVGIMLVSCCVINCTNRFRNASGIGSMQFVGRIGCGLSPCESAVFTSCQVRS